MMRKLYFAFATLIASSSTAMASTFCQIPSNEERNPELWAEQCANNVPELSPVVAAAAVTVVLAMVALVWERRRAAAL